MISVLDFANSLLIRGDKPNQWSRSNIIPIVDKFTNRLILNRIQPVLDKHQRPNQNGFRPGMHLDQPPPRYYWALRRLIGVVKANNLPAVILFLDFPRAFDSLHREKMLRILKAYSIPEELVNAVVKMYAWEHSGMCPVARWRNRLVWNHSGGIAGRHSCRTPSLTKWWSRQTLKAHGNPTGFTVEPRKSKRHPPITVSDLDFADDIAFILGHIDEAQSLLLLVENSVANVGLHLNAVKSQAILYNQDPIVIETKSNDSMQ